MNILLLVSWYPTDKNPNFGVFIKEHAHSIHVAGASVVVLALVVHRDECLWKKSVSDFVDEAGVRTVLIEISSRYRDLIYHAVHFQYCIMLAEFKRRVQSDFKPEIIHSNVIFPAGIVGSFFAKKLRLKHVITEHWTRVNQFSKMPFLSGLGRNAYRKASAILPVSAYLQSIIANTFDIQENSKFHVIGNVINPDIFTFQEKTRNPEELRLCSIATWSKLKDPAKQPELLIKAVAGFQKESDVHVKLTMVGGGNKLDALKALCLEMNVDAVFTGYLPKNEIAEILHHSDYFVHPTLVETFGVVVAEALCTGTPVICSDTSALKELVDDSNGILCDNTVDAWILALKKAVNLSFDYQAISTAVRNKYDLNSVGNQIVQVYQEILKQR